MNAKLQLQSYELAYNESGANSNQPMRYVDWNRTRTLAVTNPASLSFPVDPGASLTVFDGTRSTSIASNTQFTMTASPLNGGRYRFTYTGVGTAPAFRADRGINLSSLTIGVVLNANQTITVTSGSGTPFSTAQVGDVVFIPGTSTGDSASPFSSLNVGYWKVLAVNGSGLSVDLARNAGTTFTGKTESGIVPSTAAQFQAFSTAGVQIGDRVSVAVLSSSYSVVSVNPKWFEVISTVPLATSLTFIPGTSGMNFYSIAKRYIRIEADQQCVARMNGDTSDFNTFYPFTPGVDSEFGVFVSTNTTWSLVIVNKSTVQMNVMLISAE